MTTIADSRLYSASPYESMMALNVRNPNFFQQPPRAAAALKKPAKKKSSNSYKKNPASVARRNERERKRVRQVNAGFQQLKKHVPHRGDKKKMSKVDTLRAATEYIGYLARLLTTDGDSSKPTDARHPYRQCHSHQMVPSQPQPSFPNPSPCYPYSGYSVSDATCTPSPSSTENDYEEDLFDYGWF